jgi:hypothetical protein
LIQIKSAAAHARDRRPMRCTKNTRGGSGEMLKPWSQTLADTDARFLVETMGAAIRALFGIERDHNAHMVRVILRDIFDHSESSIQIAKPQRATNQKSESQISTSSRFIVGAACRYSV